jgi:hypothetical protein
VHQVGDKKSYTMMHGQPIIKMEYLSQFNRLRSKGYYNLSPGLITKILFSAHTVFLYVLCGSEKKNSDYSPHKINFLLFHYRGGECLLRGTDWMFKYNASQF